ncbi:ATP-binding cassette domain-containing protein [Microvirga sp. TS319]|uniref:ATP-binding cassette domain-containing protein n=1 Tax=Microvirga sp. TS319 TaxID=3241165 RepID=UPI00351A397E
MDTLAHERDEELPSLIRTTSILLDTPGTCHAVVEGEVDLYAVRPNHMSARHPLGRIGRGGLLFGSDPSLLGDETLLAVPSADARIYRLPGEGWRAEKPLEAFATGAAAWLAALAAGIGHGIEPKPRLDVAFSDALPAPLPLPPKAVVGCGSGVVWIDLPEEGGLLFGVEPVQGLIPLPMGAWVTLDQGGAVTVLSWSGGLARADWSTALDAFNAASTELLPVVRGFAEADEFNRIQSREQAEDHDRQQTAERFAEILHNAVPQKQETIDHGLMDVLRILGKELGIRIQRPAKARRAQMDRLSTAEEICRASGILLQSVALDEGWWRFEMKPLLARRRNGDPVALIWRRGRYEEVDRTGARRVVSGKVADTIEPLAQMPFLPHPAKIGLIELLVASLRKGGPDTLAFLAATLTGSLIGQLLPMMTTLVFGILVPAAMQDSLAQIGVVIMLVGVAGFLVHIAGETARQRLMTRGDGAIFDATWSRIVALPLAELRKQPSAMTAARVGASVSTVAGLRQFLYSTGSTLGMVLSSLATIAWNSPLLAALAAGLVTVHVATGLLAGWLQARAYLTGEQLMGAADSHMVQMVNGIVKLRSGAAEERAVLRWADRFAAMRNRLVKARRVMNVYESWLAAYPIFGSAALFWLIHTLAVSKDGSASLPIASVIAVVTAFTIMFASVGQFLRSILSVWMLKPSWTFAKPLLETPPERLTGLSDPGSLTGEIEFSSVGFRYDENANVLNGISFRAAPGEAIAIVGSSGSGKSTLVRLLLGLEKPTSGAIYIDGQDIRSLHPTALRRQIGAVLQDEKLPPGSIMDIVRGTTDADPDAIWRALKAAAMDEDVAAMPMGIHTVLPDASRTLSGGQVQRLALARAFLHKPPIMVLDEATSALDNATQARAMQTVMSMPATRIIVAHRLSTIRYASRIIVLHEGRIVESGTYADLMKRRGRFAGLAEGLDGGRTAPAA